MRGTERRACRSACQLASNRRGETCDIRLRGRRFIFPAASTDNLAFQNCANHRSLSRPPSRRQPFRSENRDQCEKSVENSLKFSRRLRVEFTAASTGLTLLAPGANTLQRWRERPHRWPQAWQANRPFRVVAHATVLLLATAPAPAPPGGRHRAPPEDDGLQPPRRSAVAGRAHRVRAALVDQDVTSMRANPRGTPGGNTSSARGVPPGLARIEDTSRSPNPARAPLAHPATADRRACCSPSSSGGALCRPPGGATA